LRTGLGEFKQTSQSLIDSLSVRKRFGNIRVEYYDIGGLSHSRCILAALHRAKVLTTILGTKFVGNRVNLLAATPINRAASLSTWSHYIPKRAR